MSERDLSGRVAIVTGAGRGIGRAIALELGRLGASVALAARTAEELERVAEAIRAAGGTALGIPTDVTDEDAVARLVERTRAQFGSVDILVNNAGAAVFEPVAESDASAWWHTVDVNLRGPYLCARAVVPYLLDQGSGHIVNIVSIAAKTVFPASSAYCAAKAGALMFSRVLAAEVRQHGVRVTAILPGSTRTPLWETAESPPDLSQMMSPERVAEAVAFVLTQPGDAVTDELHLLPPRGIL